MPTIPPIAIHSARGSSAPRRAPHRTPTLRGARDPRAAMEALARDRRLPPDAVDRQRLLECLGNAERNVRVLKHKEASKWVMQVGAQLHKLGGDALKIAERVFQHAVFLAKQLDDGAPDFIAIEFERNNTERLGDAYTWLGAVVAAAGKPNEAENHYRAARARSTSRSSGCVEGQTSAQGDFLPQPEDARSRRRRSGRAPSCARARARRRGLALAATRALLQRASMGASHLVVGPGRRSRLGGELAADQRADARR